MKKVFSYIRFSTPEQAKGDSLRRQLKLARVWCEERNLVLDETLRDLGVSAYTGSNRTTGALGSFLNLVETGKVPSGSILLVESLDRLSRETVLVAANSLIALVCKGITVVTLTDNREFSSERLNNDWTPLMMSLATMHRAHEESHEKGKRVREAWGKKRDAARAEGRPMTKRCPAWIEIENKKFKIVPDRAQVVQRIFRMAIDGFGLRTIIKVLNAEGEPAFKGKNGWQTSSLRRLLMARTVLGEYQPHVGRHWNKKPEGDPIKNYYPAIIDEDTFWSAQTAIERRRGRGGPRGPQIAHLLQGIAKCGECGAAAHILNKGAPPKGGLYFQCSKARRSAGCANTTLWRVEKIENRLLAALPYVDYQAVVHGTQNDEEADRIATLEAKLADAERRRKRLIVLVESGDDAATQRFTEVAEDVKAFKHQLKGAREAAGKATARRGELKTYQSSIKDLMLVMGVCDDERKRETRIRLAEQIRKLITQVEFDPQEGVFARLQPQLTIPSRHIPRAVHGGVERQWRIWLNDSDPTGLREILREDPEDADQPKPTLKLKRRQNVG